jgi:hypothetical protein
VEDNELTVTEAIESGLKQLTKGVKKVEADAYYDALWGGKVEVVMYWVGKVARIDIKGLK